MNHISAYQFLSEKTEKERIRDENKKYIKDKFWQILTMLFSGAIICYFLFKKDVFSLDVELNTIIVVLIPIIVLCKAFYNYISDNQED